MTDRQKPHVDLDNFIEIHENKAEKTKDVTSGFGDDSVQEMPTITTLLQRKKLSAVKTTETNLPPKPTSDNEIVRNSSANADVHEPTSIIFSPTIDINSAESTVAFIASEVTRPHGIQRSASDSTRKTSRVTIAEQPSIVASKRSTSWNSTKSIDRVEGGAAGQPPKFTKTLALEPLDLKKLQKSLKAHKKSGDLRKLDCLGYFSSRFSEIAYYQVSQPGALEGIVGFGHSLLVTGTRGKMLAPEAMPSVFEKIAQGEAFVGGSESLSGADQQALKSMGFRSLKFVAVVPMIYKKTVSGIWICSASTAQEIPDKELKNLKSVFTDLVF